MRATRRASSLAPRSGIRSSSRRRGAALGSAPRRGELRSRRTTCVLRVLRDPHDGQLPHHRRRLPLRRSASSAVRLCRRRRDVEPRNEVASGASDQVRRRAAQAHARHVARWDLPVRPSRSSARHDLRRRRGADRDYLGRSRRSPLAARSASSSARTPFHVCRRRVVGIQQRPRAQHLAGGRRRVSLAVTQCASGGAPRARRAAPSRRAPSAPPRFQVARPARLRAPRPRAASRRRHPGPAQRHRRSRSAGERHHGRRLPGLHRRRRPPQLRRARAAPPRARSARARQPPRWSIAPHSCSAAARAGALPLFLDRSSSALFGDFGVSPTVVSDPLLFPSTCAPPRFLAARSVTRAQSSTSARRSSAGTRRDDPIGARGTGGGAANTSEPRRSAPIWRWTLFLAGMGGCGDEGMRNVVIPSERSESKAMRRPGDTANQADINYFASAG